MDKNVGNTDRLVRFVVGGVLAVVGLVQLGGVVSLATGTLGLAIGVVAILLGLVLVWTGYTRSCLLYGPLGINTARGESANEEESEPEPSA
jgi:hypothetical protein